MVLAVATVLSLCIGAFDYVDADKITKGKENAINAVYDWGIMQGNNKGEFNPTSLLTRDEMSKIMYAMKETGLDVPTWYNGFLAGAFVDAASVPAWSKNYMGYAYVENIFVGNAKNEINALGTLSYAEATIVLLRALGVKGDNYVSGGVTYSAYEGPDWLKNAAVAGNDNGLFEGLDIDNFTAAITREDVAVMIYNAVNKANENKKNVEQYVYPFKLAEKTTGVVTGTETKDDVNYFKLDDGTENGATYAIGDLNVADYMGKKVSFCVEDKKVVSAITTDATVINTTVGAISQEEIDGVDCWTVDGKKLAKVDDVKSFYLFKNNTKKANDKVYTAEEAKTMLTAEAAFQNITLINNGDSISVVYNPIYFVTAGTTTGTCVISGVNGECKIEREVKDKKYTGKYCVVIDGKTLYVGFSKLEANTYYAFSLNGNEVIGEGTLTTISVSDISASLKKDEYTFTYKGETMTVNDQLDKNCTASELFNKIVDGKKYNALVYNNVILKIEEVKEDPKPAELKTYAYILDVTTTASAGSKVYVVKALVGATDVETFIVKNAAVENTPEVEKLYVYTVAEEDNKDTGIKKGDVLLGASYEMKPEKDWDKTEFKASDYANKKTVVLYNEDLGAYVDASTLVMKDGVITLDGFEIYKGALKYYEDSDYMYIVYATK